jgi:hypothetical protein
VLLVVVLDHCHKFPQANEIFCDISGMWFQSLDGLETLLQVSVFVERSRVVHIVAYYMQYLLLYPSLHALSRA